MLQFTITSIDGKRSLWASRNLEILETNLREYYDVRYDRVKRTTPSEEQIALSIRRNRKLYDSWIDHDDQKSAINLGVI